eukprot:SAG31_NODE_10380_length_1145_cov_2.323136_2_plen_24_part_01
MGGSGRRPTGGRICPRYVAITWLK